jgi:hypothetical protein
MTFIGIVAMVRAAPAGGSGLRRRAATVLPAWEIFDYQHGAVDNYVDMTAPDRPVPGGHRPFGLRHGRLHRLKCIKINSLINKTTPATLSRYGV